MRRQKVGTRKVRLQRETIRTLDERTLAPRDLEQVAGGKRGCWTWECLTWAL